eukprot:SAG31_NODE_5420_length_2548_cov_1.444671_2_plen_67_part_00
MVERPRYEYVNLNLEGAARTYQDLLIDDTEFSYVSHGRPEQCIKSNNGYLGLGTNLVLIDPRIECQ